MAIYWGKPYLGESLFFPPSSPIVVINGHPTYGGNVQGMHHFFGGIQPNFGYKLVLGCEILVESQSLLVSIYSSCCLNHHGTAQEQPKKNCRWNHHFVLWKPWNPFFVFGESYFGWWKIPIIDDNATRWFFQNRAPGIPWAAAHDWPCTSPTPPRRMDPLVPPVSRLTKNPQKLARYIYHKP